MRALIVCIGIFLLAACNADRGNDKSIRKHAIAQPGQRAYDSLSYAKLKERIRLGHLPAKGQELYTIVVDSVLPYWYTTAWDYNGVTQVPRKGKIACGYFVTTVLRDAGLPIERVKLAQAPSSDLIKAVCTAGSIRHLQVWQAFDPILTPVPHEACSFLVWIIMLGL